MMNTRAQKRRRGFWEGKLALAALLILSTSLWPQTAPREARFETLRRARQERPEEDYVRISRAERQTSPAYRFSSAEIFTAQVNVSEFGLNIVGDAANEPSLARSPANPNSMALGWRQFDTIASNFRQAGYGFTADGGNTWLFPGTLEPGVFRSDPVLDSDAEGNFYYNSLTVRGSDFLCHVFKSRDGGMTWDTGTFAQGGDKQWMVIDNTSGPGRGNIYAYWTQYYSVCRPGFFTRSHTRGASFENCTILPDENMHWGTLAIGRESELYVCGESDSGFVVTRSRTAADSNQAVTWEHTANVDLDGTIRYGGGPNPGGLLGQVWVATDAFSTGALRGNVYLLCSVQRFSTDDPCDVMFARSADRGETWSAPVRVNDDTTDGAWQWFGTMSVAPNGRIDVIWLDTRDDPTGFDSALYYAYSWDGGETWSKNERLSEAFDPHVGWPRQSKMGDYFHMISENEFAHLAWAATFNGEQDVYYSRISAPTVAVAEAKPESAPVKSFALAQNYPNPFNPSTTINYTLARGGEAALRIVNEAGAVVRTLIRAAQTPGSHRVVWDGRNDSGELLASGPYFYTLTLGGREVIARRMLLLK